LNEFATAGPDSVFFNIKLNTAQLRSVSRVLCLQAKQGTPDTDEDIIRLTLVENAVKATRLHLTFKGDKLSLALKDAFAAIDKAMCNTSGVTLPPHLLDIFADGLSSLFGMADCMPTVSAFVSRCPLATRMDFIKLSITGLLRREDLLTAIVVKTIRDGCEALLPHLDTRWSGTLRCQSETEVSR
jgi:hypothetical protein